MTHEVLPWPEPCNEMSSQHEWHLHHFYRAAALESRLRWLQETADEVIAVYESGASLNVAWAMNQLRGALRKIGNIEE